MLVFLGIWAWAWLPHHKRDVRRAGEAADGGRVADGGRAMSDFWSGWVICFIVLNARASRSFLFLWALRVEIPTQPDGTSGHVWAHGVLQRRRAQAADVVDRVLGGRGSSSRIGYLVLYPGLRRVQGHARLDLARRARAAKAANRAARRAVARARARQDGRGDRRRSRGDARGRRAVRRELRGVPWPRRARQCRARRAQPDRRATGCTAATARRSWPASSTGGAARCRRSAATLSDDDDRRTSPTTSRACRARRTTR